ncbi:mannose/cellobiose epimerase-like protein (N-acyl-D-glucosamine 2-epimerase family) [Nocardioides albertanoniae]|uniref:Mannose/cellobiose epimerase-like protein (N-acyl-D-glucosamine 2-epimerase family) n=1 Tax=Nocardioides albertanoniae TaxID=1175486 RepID=A0A543ADB8_9ACTN|nr:AGE family epimerase/isomerase [Nocardioides albertanoniae]TQL70571.1 mannose/cellobiose epimerase-like protein (N-acyl-D-glucosamine 2-epimerase family) [Nocardioides albertanoniae]
MPVPGSRRWREQQLDSVLRFARRSALPDGGFGRLDAAGEVQTERGLELWINARMTYVFAIASMREGAVDPLAQHGVRALRDFFVDPEHGGWFAAVTADHRRAETRKGCYEHAFVVLAASAARLAGVPGAAELLDKALDVHDRWFWDEQAGRCREAWDAGWTTAEAYRGVNSNMHTVEAYLTASDATGDPRWRDRALRICEQVVAGARANGWRLPEHFDAEWRVLLDYNAGAPADPFRPYGATPGHGLEWSRLLVGLEGALDDPPRWLVEAATALYVRAVRDGSVGDTIVYTTDWEGEPVTRERFHWVMAEAVAAADTLARRTDGAAGAADLDRWWRAIENHFVDHRHGSWHHELDDAMRVSGRTWPDKPDAYHAVNALLLPDAPLAPTLARTLAARLES